MLSGLVLSINNDLCEVYILEKNRPVYIFAPQKLKQYLCVGFKYPVSFKNNEYVFQFYNQERR